MHNKIPSYMYISLNGKIYQVEIASEENDIEMGMTKYKAPPSYGMMFYLEGRDMLLSMKGMYFPLDILFLDSNMKVISRRKSYPNDGLSPIPRGTYYMLEFPLGIYSSI